MPKYPCRYCLRYRGRNGFRRGDHFIQHVRSQHPQIPGATLTARRSNLAQFEAPLTCPHPDCPSYRGESYWDLEASEQDRDRPFEGQKDYNKHMKEAHDETPFPCPGPGCDKVGAKGYLQEKALIKHYTDKHPEIKAYIPQARGKKVEAKRLQCRQPGCGKMVRRGGLSWHMYNVHGIKP
ncbi:hypothetical protein ACHAQA_000259 [Verticillium albo-atrum]